MLLVDGSYRNLNLSFCEICDSHRSVAEDSSFWDVKLCCLVACSRLPFETSGITRQTT